MLDMETVNEYMVWRLVRATRGNMSRMAKGRSSWANWLEEAVERSRVAYGWTWRRIAQTLKPWSMAATSFSVEIVGGKLEESRACALLFLS
jgi:hypothetical protein